MSGEPPKPPRTREGFRIGVICALYLEAGMVEMVFDKIWRKKDGVVFGKLPTDQNTYTVGLIAGHNVVLAYCHDLGANAASQVADSLKHSFPKIEIVFIVGICGAVPTYSRHGRTEDIMLGDCIFSTGVVQFDLGENGPKGLRKADGLDALGKANIHIRGLMNKLQTPMNRRDLTDDLQIHLQAIQSIDTESTSYPGAQHDRLYNSEYVHIHHQPNQSCEMCEPKLGICRLSCRDLGCDDQYLEHRARSPSGSPRIHVGYFGSSNSVLKNGKERDSLARTDNIIAFEMEGSGVWEVRSTVIIKAACDYADSHINKAWQSYAAAVAAAGLKAFLQDLELPDTRLDDTVDSLVAKIASDDSFSHSTNHGFQANIVHGGITYYHGHPPADHPHTSASQQNKLDDDRIKQDVNRADAAIRDYYLSSGRLKIERLSKELLDLDECYINLALVNQAYTKEQKQSLFSLESRLKLEASDVGRKIALHELFINRKLPNGSILHPRRIFIEGRAGIGKTTLCKKIVHEFLNHRLENDKLFDRLLWLPLRSLKSKPVKYQWQSLFEDAFTLQVEDSGELAKVMSKQFYNKEFLRRTLFLFDGLDEVSHKWIRGDPMYEFLSTIICDIPNIILTSRPRSDGFNIGKFDLELETLGFTPNQVNIYLENCVKDQQTVANMKKLITQKPLLQGLLRIPIQLDAFCCIWPDRVTSDTDYEKLASMSVTDDLSTMTNLYQSITSKLYIKDVERLEKTNLARKLIDTRIRELLRRELLLLEELAFQGLVNSIITFTPEHRDLVESYLLDSDHPEDYNSFDLERLSFLRTSDIKQDKSKSNYHFLHLTFQEFFAAKHFVRHWRYNTDLTCLSLEYTINDNREIMSPHRFLQTHKYSPELNIFWRFVTGLVQTRPERQKVSDGQKLLNTGKTILDLFHELNGQPRDLLGAAHHRLMMYCLSEVMLNSTREIQDMRAREEDLLRQCTITESKLKPGIALGKEAEFPENVLCYFLQNKDDLSYWAILKVLESRLPLSIKTLCAVSNYMSDGFEIKTRLLAIKVIFKNSRPDSQKLTARAASSFSKMLSNGDANVRRSVIQSLAGLSSLPGEVVDILITALKNQDGLSQRDIAQILKKQSHLSAKAINALTVALKDEKPKVRRFAMEVLGRQPFLPVKSTSAIITVLKNDSDDVRGDAADALRGQSSIEVISALITALKDEKDEVKARAVYALAGKSSIEAISALITILKGESTIRQETVYALSEQPYLHSEIINALVPVVIKDRDVTVRSLAITALGKQPFLPEEATSALITVILEDEDGYMRGSAIEALTGQSSAEISTAMIAGLVKDEDSYVRACVVRALKRQSLLSAEVVGTLITAVTEDERPGVRTEAIKALAEQPALSEEAVMALIAAVHEDKDHDVRSSAVEALGGQSSTEVVDTLITALKDEQLNVQVAAVIALQRQSSLSREIISTLIAMLERQSYLAVETDHVLAILSHHNLFYTTIPSSEDRVWQQLWLYWVGASPYKSICCYEFEGHLYAWLDAALYRICSDPSRTQELLGAVSSNEAQQLQVFGA